MTDKICLQWNDFRENVSFAFGYLRNEKELTDVTLACEDGQQIEAHKIILAASRRNPQRQGFVSNVNGPKTRYN